MSDPRLPAIPDIHGHAKGEHKLFAEERPIPYHARLIFLWFYHAANRRSPRFVMVSDHVNYLTFEDPAAVSLVRRALKLALAGDLYGASETAKVDMHHAKVVSDAMRAGMRFSIGAEMDNDPRSRPDAQNVIDAMKPDGVIRSIHFIPIKHPDTGEEWMWPFDNPEFKHFFEKVGVEETWQMYTDLMVDAVKTLPGDILGHLHVPGKFGHWPSESNLEIHEDRILDACAERGMGIEINTRVFYRSSDPAVHEQYLNLYRRLLRKCVGRDLPIAIGSDAHSPKDQGGGIDRILPLLDEADINEIVFPINGTLARVALRADRPIKSRPSVVIQPARQVIVSELDAESIGENPAAPGAAVEAPAQSVPPPAPQPPPAPLAVESAPEPEPAPVTQTAPAPVRESQPLAEEVAATEPVAEIDEILVPIATKPEPKPSPAPKAKPAAKSATKTAAVKAASEGSATTTKAPAKKPTAKASGEPVKTAAAKAAPTKAAVKSPAAKAPAKKAAAAKPQAKPAAAKAPAKKAAPKKPAAKKPAKGQS